MSGDSRERHASTSGPDPVHDARGAVCGWTTSCRDCGWISDLHDRPGGALAALSQHLRVLAPKETTT